MDLIIPIATIVAEQFQKPTLAFLVAGMLLAAMGSRFEIPEPVYKFIVVLLLLKVGMSAGLSIRGADVMALVVPALAATAVGITIVFLGCWTLVRVRGTSEVDGMATAGLFGAVSASTLAAAMAMLNDSGIAYEGYIGALYPFMDIAALVTAISLAKMSAARKASSLQAQGNGAAVVLTGDPRKGAGEAAGAEAHLLKSIIIDTVRSPAISALVAGLALGMLSKPDSVFDSFYEPLFRGLLSILMLIMGMEAWGRLSEMKGVAHAYIIYGIAAPFAHGLLGFSAGLVAHELTGFSAGGVILLAVMAASSSDISGPPTIRGALPEANTSAYVGTSTGIGTPVALLTIPLWIALAQTFV